MSLLSRVDLEAPSSCSDDHLGLSETAEDLVIQEAIAALAKLGLCTPSDFDYQELRERVSISSLPS